MKKLILLILITPLISWADIMMVEFAKKPKSSDIEKIKKIFGVKYFGRLTPYKSEFFERSYELHTKTSDETIKDSIVRKVKQSGLIKRIEDAKRFELNSVIPSSEKTSITKDYLFNYQWNLHNSQQVIIDDIDDIRPEPFTGKRDFDFGWIPYYQKYESTIKNELRVAVIDSGVYIAHPELKSNIKKRKRMRRW